MSDILVHTEAGVCTLSFNRLERKNSITSAMYATMANAVTQAAGDATVRVLVFQGHETVFSAGNDIGDFLNAPPAGKDSPVFRFLRGIALYAGEEPVQFGPNLWALPIASLWELGATPVGGR